MPDDEWWSLSGDRYESIRPNFSGTVESFCEGGDVRSGLGDDGAAIYFYHQSVDLMQTLYIFSGMQNRRPSPRDAAPINGYMRTLGRVRETRPDAPIERQVRNVTFLLRTMATAAERQGFPNDVYHQGLDKLTEIAPHVDVSDVFWEPLGG